MSLVLDASSILAIIFRERGAEAVLARTNGAHLSAVNLFEILDKAQRLRSIAPATLTSRLRQLKIDFVDYDAAQATIASTLPTKANGRPLSLADRACLSLAIHRNLPILTGDRDWMALDLPIAISLFR